MVCTYEDDGHCVALSVQRLLQFQSARTREFEVEQQTSGKRLPFGHEEFACRRIAYRENLFPQSNS